MYTVYVVLISIVYFHVDALYFLHLLYLLISVHQWNTLASL